MGLTFTTATPFFAFDDELRIITWNEGAKELTGIPAADAIGAPCWSILGGIDDAGHAVCHKDCLDGRLVRKGCPVPAQVMRVHASDGRRRVAVESVIAHGDGESVYLHLMREVPEPVADEAPADVKLGPPPRLTRRQIEVLGLIAQGVTAREIAGRLYLAETTVRNHIRALFLELRVHSQLEAVFVARRHGLI
jgi:DNA-binding CsgD family transcriptional regulator